MKRRRRDILVLPAIAALVVLVDQFSKHFVTVWLGEGQSWDIVPWLAPVFRITHVTNTGAVFGLLPGWSDFFTVIAAIVIVVIIVYYRQIPDGQWLARAALGLQLGGAIGNLVDRLRRGERPPQVTPMPPVFEDEVEKTRAVVRMAASTK